jgi:hypothetical protein
MKIKITLTDERDNEWVLNRHMDRIPQWVSIYAQIDNLFERVKHSVDRHPGVRMPVAHDPKLGQIALGG